jgi:hypothetical protein
MGNGLPNGLGGRGHWRECYEEPWRGSTRRCRRVLGAILCAKSLAELRPFIRSIGRLVVGKAPGISTQKLLKEWLRLAFPIERVTSTSLLTIQRSYVAAPQTEA